MKKLSMLFILISIFACNRTIPPKNVKNIRPLVVLSVYNNNVENWLKNADTNLRIIAAFGINNDDSLKKLLSLADGIIITGGEDINPALYGKADEINKCYKISPKRDTLEIKMTNYAISNNIPLLGICRGEQMINVATGGTLYTDIPTDIGSLTMHRHHGATTHSVKIIQNTLLHSIVGVDSGTVYSNHHQGVEKLGRHLLAAAYAPDSLIEAIEFYDTIIHPFVMGVQWHPEKMKQTNPLSYRIRDFFIKKVIQHSKLKNKQKNEK